MGNHIGMDTDKGQEEEIRGFGIYHEIPVHVPSTTCRVVIVVNNAIVGKYVWNSCRNEY